MFVSCVQCHCKWFWYYLCQLHLEKKKREMGKTSRNTKRQIKEDSLTLIRKQTNKNKVVYYLVPIHAKTLFYCDFKTRNTGGLL
jgi:hypothetical protein